MGNAGINTHAWRQLRATWADHITWAASIGRPITCPRCGNPITPNHEWDLGHKINRADGGTTQTGVHPEHATCNRRAGGQRRHQHPRTRRW